MLQFHETGYGRDFFNHQLPELIRAINRNAKAIEDQNAVALQTLEALKENNELLKSVLPIDGEGSLMDLEELMGRSQGNQSETTGSLIARKNTLETQLQGLYEDLEKAKKWATEKGRSWTPAMIEIQKQIDHREKEIKEINERLR